VGALPFLAAAVALSFCSLVYELALAKAIAEVTGNATIWESVSMATFLMGLGARALWPLPPGDRSLARALLRTEVLLPVAAVAAVHCVALLEIFYRIYLFDGGLLREMWAFPPVTVLGVVAQVTCFAVGWLSGVEMQFFLGWRLEDGPVRSRREAAVLAVYHGGGLLGTLAFAVALVRAWSPTSMIAAAALVNLAFVATAAPSFAESRRDARRWRGAAVVGLLLVVGGWLAEGPLERVTLLNRYLNVYHWRASGMAGMSKVQHPLGPVDLIVGAWQDVLPADGVPDVRRIRTPYQVIDLETAAGTADDAGAPSAAKGAMHINGRFQIATESSAAYHESLVHLGAALAGRTPASAAILGGGDGGVLKELLKYGAALPRIVMVDIDPVIIDLARHEPFLKAANGDALASDRYELVVGDALAWLRQDERTWDAVFMDLTYPFDFDSARFLTVEFLRLVRRHLVPGGYMTVGAPDNLVLGRHPQVEKVVRATAHAAGFSELLAFSVGQSNFLLLATAPLAEAPRLPEGIPLESLTVKALDKEKRRAMPPLDDRAYVNSAFAPRWLGLPDPFY
jgi:predicted membrane-bound spermidine synthase